MGKWLLGKNWEERERLAIWVKRRLEKFSTRRRGKFHILKRMRPSRVWKIWKWFAIISAFRRTIFWDFPTHWKSRFERAGEKAKEIRERGLTRAADCDIINNANRKDGEQEFHGENAGVAELADARDLKSRDTKVSYRFDPGHRHHRGRKSGSKPEGEQRISRSRAAW